jgi:hypothetical protein
MNQIVYNNNIIKFYIEVIIWLFLAVLYFQFILPYYLNEEIIRNFNNFSNDIIIPYQFKNASITPIGSILLQEINYTNNNIYIQI